ncbi:cytochrome P450 [Phlegmacium glaucopus]|nr:cytochrome P450 [Phlegmacium glaucopus]
MLTLALTAACILIPYFVYWKALRSVQFMPGYRPMLAPTSLPGAMFPESWWNLGGNWAYRFRKTAFFNYQHDIISIVPWLVGEPSYATCSLDVARQVMLNENQRQSELLKPERFSLPFLLWGDNVLTSHGEMWKRHKRIMGPAFNAKMYSNVVEQTISIYRDMVEIEGWKGQAEVVVENLRRLPVRLAFLVIARCGFGMSLKYAEDANVDQNTENDMTVERGFGVISATIIQRLAFPKWLYKLPIKRIRKIDQAWKLLASFMDKSIELRGEQLANDPSLLDESRDIFTRLVAANDDKAKYRLDPSEVIGNTFILMFAGHETTALVLTATIAHLALHQDEQEKAYQEITSTIPLDSDPNLDHLSKLTHTLACFTEALRLQPPAQYLARTLQEDLPVKVQRPQEETIVLKAGTLLLIHLLSMHRNPNIFPSPDKFQPSRWYNVPEHDMSMFGIGPRACIGRKFGIVESLAFLSMLLREWKVDVVLREGETRDDWGQRVIENAGPVGMTFGIAASVDVKLSRR